MTSKRDAYVEARLGLLEEVLSQIFGFLPPEPAQLIAEEYNSRRAAILAEHPEEKPLIQLLGPH